VSRTAAVVLTGVTGERTVTALQLAERLLARGHRVTVYAHDTAASAAAVGGELTEAVAALLRRGVHGATLDWVTDGAGARRVGAEAQAPGVVTGDHADLWAFVRDADIVLSPGGA
jgi:hypothetical protein